jgi:hypothetical protein
MVNVTAMTMGPSVRKLVLTAHIACSVGWLGSVVAYLALAAAALRSSDSQTLRAAWIGMELTGWSVLNPLALVALLTGLILALGTPWGLFLHYWVLISFVLTIIATAVLVLHMPTVSALANVARVAEGAELRRLGGDILHPAVGLLVLLVITALNVYKPQGLTPYGWRKLHEQRRVS